MKRMLLIVLAVILLISGVIFVYVKNNEKQHQQYTTGGWDKTERELTQEDIDIFNLAMEGYTGMGFVPLKLCGTQIVAGRNYKYYCEGTVVSTNEKKYYYVTVYKNLEGECEITSVVEAQD